MNDAVQHCLWITAMGNVGHFTHLPTRYVKLLIYKGESVGHFERLSC